MSGKMKLGKRQIEWINSLKTDYKEHHINDLGSYNKETNRLEKKNSNEVLINNMRSSQLINLGYYLLCLLLAPLIVGIVIFMVRYLKTHFNLFKMTEKRIVITKGVFSRRIEEIELFRVKSVALDEPWQLRMFGLANIVILSSDLSVPEYKLIGVKNAEELMEIIRNNYLLQKELHKVREIDGL